MPDVKRRVALAMQRMGALRHVFNSSIPLALKMKIYKTAICSLLTYGCEAWTLDEKTLAMINGANARCLSWFTGNDSHTEASVRTRSYDLVHAIRTRRFKWLGHILRMEDNRLVKLAAKQQFTQGLPGNMFYDVPPHLSFQQIEKAASSRELWRRLATLLRPRPHSSDTTGSERKRQMSKMSLLLPGKRNRHHHTYAEWELSPEQPHICITMLCQLQPIYQANHRNILTWRRYTECVMHMNSSFGREQQGSGTRAM